MTNPSKETILEVESRNPGGSNAAGRLRRAGTVPGNVYGLALPPFQVSVNARRIHEVLMLGSGQNTILTLTMAGDGGSKREVMIRELQRDPLTSHVLHVDFLRVDINRVVHVNVPIQLLGLSEGVKNEGGVLDFVHREVEVSCLPSAIPEHLDVDVSGLHLNQNVSAAELTIPEGVELLEDPETIIATVSAAKAEVTETPTEEEEAVADADAAAPATEETSGDSTDKGS